MIIASYAKREADSMREWNTLYQGDSGLARHEKCETMERIIPTQPMPCLSAQTCARCDKRRATIGARYRIAALCIVLAAALPRSAVANLVTDGDFNQVTYSGTLPLVSGTAPYGQFGTGYLTVAGWTTTGYNFVYAPGTGDAGTQANGANSATVQEAPGQYNTANGYGNTYMWGPQNGAANGLPATDPAGGNYIAMDGTYEVGAVSQTINGLKVGSYYQLTFYWAGAQQQGFTTATTESLTATLGTEGFSTGTVSISGSGFSGWMSGTFEYQATGTSETLTFLAYGTPNGEPPFTLLGGVDLELVPDFSNWMVFAGFGAACIAFESMRRRRRHALRPPVAIINPAGSFPGVVHTALSRGAAEPPVSA
jgi:hypothetical protein